MSNPQSRYRLMWMDVKYEPGVLKVIALDSAGNALAEKSISTAGKPAKIVLTPDRSTIDADGKDLSFITVSVVDKNGIPCPTASTQMNFSVTGRGIFKAACNGDATSLEAFHKPTMKLFNGKLVILVQSKAEIGQINLAVKGKGLKSGVLKLFSKAM